MSTTKYSVLMSVYGRDNPGWLVEAINSMLEQTIVADEFVIVKDGKLTTELEEVINVFCKKRPKLFKIVQLERNVGLGLALAEGIKKCKNELIARMDADDYSEPNRIEEQLKIFATYPDIGLVGSNVNEFTYDKNNPTCLVKLPETRADIMKFAKKRCPFRHPSLIYKKSAVISAGNYRDFPFYEDYDLYIRLLNNGVNCYNIQKPFVKMRINENFYKRRGGMKYAADMLHFKNYQLSNNFLNFPEYLVTTVPHLIVCLLPNGARKLIYQKLLRKGVEND